MSCTADPVDDPLDGKGCSHAQAAMHHLPSSPATLFNQLRDEVTDTDALHYNLDIEVDPATEWIGGSNTLIVESKVDGLTTFQFRLRDQFNISSVDVGGTPVAWNRLSTTTVEVTLDRPYDIGEVFELTVAYDGFPVSGGFGSIEFRTHDGEPIVYTLSEPWFAYTWWPAKDDNTDKATGDLSITVPNTMVVASNGLLIDVEDVAGDKKKYHWRTDYQTATYLFCFAATNYNTFDAVWDYNDVSMPMQFFIYPESDSTSNRDKWLKTLDILTAYSNAYGVYPFSDEKYGICQFNFGGGMEHQTMTGQGTFSESITAHEASHQWWGDMITCATWHDIWLNEGFATYSEAIWYERKPGSSGEPALHNAMANRRPSAVNDSVYVYDTSSVSRIFSGTFSYRKGAWVLHQLRHVVGDETFFDILAAYREAFLYSSATTADLQLVAETVWGWDLSWFFNEWIYEIGAPTYEYGWREITAGEKRYVELYVEQVQDASYPVFTMPIDIVTTDADGETVHVVWNDADAEHLLFEVDVPVTGLAFDPTPWILHEGAAEIGFTEGPAKIVAVHPAPGDDLPPWEVGTINIAFHKDVVVEAADFLLLDGEESEVEFSFAYDVAEYVVTLTPDHVLPADTYTLTAADSITDVAAGLSLDGEMAHPYPRDVLPSGDGLPGGNAVISFDVQLAGDLNGNGTVDQSDLGILLAAYDISAGGDIDGDGDTDQQDLGILLANYGASR
ncbi:MAG: M1 family metallopeptidase [Phycisphaerales bacterium]|nr:M1 family metallopeptidase [Phycisphaerales bacterium]